MKILVVDDDPIILDLLSAVLRDEGHHDICVASSGGTALEMLKSFEGSFDVMILDIAMPEMDGIALCKRIRDLPKYQSTPIIMLTAKSDNQTVEHAFAAGANDYVTKPFDIKAIGSRIQIAERMMRESCQIVARHALTHTLPDAFDTGYLAFADPVRITGIAQHTDPFSLGNCLTQLSRKQIDKTTVFAAKINGFEALYDEQSDREILLAIAEVSAAITSATRDDRLLNTYLGSGVFMCLGTLQVLDVWRSLERQVDQCLRQSISLKAAKLGVSVTVTVGRPFRPIAGKSKRVRSTFDRALHLLEKRMEPNTAAG